MSRGRQAGQALVEFALIAPLLIMMLLVLLDFGRGLFLYTEMATGAREMARQATLQYNAQSNTCPAGPTAGPSPCPAPSCSPCQVPGVLPQLQDLAGLGYGAPVYSLSPNSGSAPTYGVYTPGSAGQLGTITLSSTAQSNTMYVFIYELDPTTGANWPTCDPCATLRTGNGKLVVVDLKMRWQPVVLAYLGGGPSLTFDAQTVSREEW